MLGRAIGQYWHALVRDVLALGYRAADMFTTLSVADMVAIVVGAPPTSSLRHFMDGGWSRTDHLLANMQEEKAGIANISEPYERPGLEARQEWGGDGSKLFNAESMTWAEMDAKDRKREAYAEDLLSRGIEPKTRVKTF